MCDLAEVGGFLTQLNIISQYLFIYLFKRAKYIRLAKLIDFVRSV